MRNQNKKATKTERTENNKKAIEYKQHGEGLFLFKNKSSVASLDLPKKSFDGKKWVGPNETWKGDSYFLTMIPREAILIETLISPNQRLQEEKMSEKLLLDQPDQITQNGKVEHVVSNDQKPLNEQDKKEEQSENKEMLLTEDPLAGVTIICD